MLSACRLLEKIQADRKLQQLGWLTDAALCKMRDRLHSAVGFARGPIVAFCNGPDVWFCQEAFIKARPIEILFVILRFWNVRYVFRMQCISAVFLFCVMWLLLLNVCAWFVLYLYISCARNVL